MVRKSSRTPKPVLKPDPDPPIEEEEKRISKRGRKPKNKTNLEGNEEKMVNQRKRKASSTASSGSKKKKGKNVKEEPESEEEDEPERNVEFRFIGDPIPVEEAHRRWPERYEPELIEKQKQEIIAIQKSKKDYCKDVDEPEEIPKVKCHYSKAFVDGTEYDLYDDAHVVSDKKDLPFICKVIEMFETEENELFFRAQWYYRPCDTVIREAVLDKEDEEQKAKDEEEGVEQTEVNEEIAEDDDDDDDLPKEDHTVHLHEKMIFTSDVQDNNSLDLLLGKICIARIPSNVDRLTKLAAIDNSDYFYELRYELPYKSFVSIPIEDSAKETIAESSGLSNVSLSKDTVAEAKATATSPEIEESSKSQLFLLDLYSGCGAMSTGLTLGAEIGGLNLVTRWAVDINQHACDTLELNHPDTYVRNEAAEDFLSLLKEWKIICDELLPQGPPNDHFEEDEVDADPEELPEELFVVESIVGISYGHPKTNADNLKKKNKDKIKPTELFFKIRWRGYGPDDDTWEPRSALSDAKLKLYEFVKAGYASKILPLPGDVDVICGGPPCQGISGFNRFRNRKSPLNDNKNFQMIVYMEIVNYLKPAYILMENVVDLVKFADGFMARHAVRRLLSLDYQVRMGIMAAGSFGLPQFRMRVFVWGARVGKKLPPYPLPTHEVVLRGNGVKSEFEQCLVAYDAITERQLKPKLVLGDAIEDLPEVQNNEQRDEIDYTLDPKSGFQNFIRLDRSGVGYTPMLYDHQPLVLNEDDHGRVCRIPKEKNACFADLEGVIKDNKGKWMVDPSRRVLLPSGKPLVPEYALSFCDGKSRKPFARLWWDETVPTVVTRAEPHNQAIMHPTQDRVLTVRENARLQGFPDYYRLRGPVKEKYIQVGNAVAVPVGKALGYTLAKTLQGCYKDEPLIKLPDDFPFAIRELPEPILD